ncbi:hypothetical protein C8R48DRAFT_775934 [Suillus tomentosus]|nr:hypothetical protein C8R48DRAFT_775934 [Suillus tomentosus]
MLRLLCIALSLFLSLQLAVADPASTVSRLSWFPEGSSLLDKDAPADISNVPTTQTHVPLLAASVATICITVQTTPPASNPNVAPIPRKHVMESPVATLVVSAATTPVVVNPATPAAVTLPGDVCCPTGTTCIAGSDQCSTGGPTGGGGTGVLTTSVAVTTSSKSTVQPKTTSSSSHTSTINEPTTTSSSSTSSTASSTGSTSNGLPQVGAAPRGIALAPGTQLVVLAAVVGLPILHHVVQAL